MKDLMEARIARLEGGYDQMNERLGSIEARLTALDEKVDRRFEEMDRKFEARFDALDRKFEVRFTAVDGRFTAFDGRFDRLDRKLTGTVFACLGANAVIAASVVGAILTVHR